MTLLQGREGKIVQVEQSGPAVAVRGVTKRFGTAANVLEDITLEVADGEFVCLLGASGCGKSTLLSLMADLEQPTAGSIAVRGGKPALMFQEPALFPWLTARENVELALRLRKVGKAERRARTEQLLELVRLHDAGPKRVHELSGGMRQRVAMARALAQDSRVLLMDEPFAALDAITRDVLHEELVRVRETQSLTVVFVTHNVREAVRLGDRVVLLSSRPGRVLKEWAVDLEPHRRLDSPQVASLAAEIVDELRSEIRRHGERA
jgi:NitT/TauT family transport system ATP-binding protein